MGGIRPGDWVEMRSGTTVFEDSNDGDRGWLMGMTMYLADKGRGWCTPMPLIRIEGGWVRLLTGSRLIRVPKDNVRLYWRPE